MALVAYDYKFIYADVGAKDALVTSAFIETVPFMKRWLITVSIYLLQDHCQN